MEAILWLVAMVVFLVLEAVTASVTTIWFAAGAFAALIASLASGEIWLQFVLFFVVSAVMLISLRPVIRKYITPKITPTNVDALIGSAGYVTADIDNLSSQGQVKLGGMPWSARSTSGDPIAEGSLVRVDKVEGVKVYVSPVRIQVKTN